MIIVCLIDASNEGFHGRSAHAASALCRTSVCVRRCSILYNLFVGFVPSPVTGFVDFPESSAAGFNLGQVALIHRQRLLAAVLTDLLLARGGY